MLKQTYEAPARFYRDGPASTIRYYVVQEGAENYTEWQAFGPAAQWLQKHGSTVGELTTLRPDGEVPKIRNNRKQAAGTRSFHRYYANPLQQGLEHHGTLEDFQGLSPVPATLPAIEDLPPCMQPFDPCEAWEWESGESMTWEGEDPMHVEPCDACEAWEWESGESMTWEGEDPMHIEPCDDCEAWEWESGDSMTWEGEDEMEIYCPS